MSQYSWPWRFVVYETQACTVGISISVYLLVETSGNACNLYFALGVLRARGLFLIKLFK